jgi:hypothetical protein
MIKLFRRLFRPSIPRRPKYGRCTWVGEEKYAEYRDRESGRIYVKMWDGGYDTFYPALYISIPTAIRILWQAITFELGPRGLPRCKIHLIHLKRPSMKSAKESIEQMLVHYRVI